MDLELDHRVEEAQVALLERYAPETSVRRVRWSRGVWTQILVAHPERIDDAVLVADAETQRRDLPAYLGMLSHVGGAGGVRRELILGRRWESLKTPALMLWGERDAFAPPEWGEDLAARIPGMRLVRIPDAGHLPWSDEPQRVVSETESFLAAKSAADSAGWGVRPATEAT
jgi:pimeloyl-ACP methyl ester carboxylesterase